MKRQNGMGKLFWMTTATSISLMAMTDDEAQQAATAMAAGGTILLMLFVMLIVEIFFLAAQHSFVKTIRVANPTLNTSPVWIWTQLIPIWSFVAIPVTLIKIDKQFSAFVQENRLDESQIKFYSNTWGWVWYIGSVLSIFIPIMGLVSLAGVIGFWVHINGVKKSVNQWRARHQGKEKGASSANDSAAGEESVQHQQGDGGEA